MLHCGQSSALTVHCYAWTCIPLVDIPLVTLACFRVMASRCAQVLRCAGVSSPLACHAVLIVQPTAPDTVSSLRLGQIAARKSKHAWGAFLDAAAAASAPAANAVEAAVEPSEGEADAPCAAHGHAHRHSHGRGKQAASPAAAPRSWSPSSSAAAAAGTPPKAPARATAEPLSPVAEPQAVTPTKKAAAAAAATKVPATPVKASPPGPATPVAGRLAARRRPLAAA